MKMAIVLFVVLSLFLQGSFGEVICEELPVGMCSFSVASSGKRCLLETYAAKDGNVEFQCKTSDVDVKNFADLIESDECVSACGLDRKSVGISSDSLLEPKFTTKLCAPECYQNCPNVVDLYHNLSLGEGVFLPDLCKLQRTMPRRAMSQLLSSGVASAPTSAAAAAAPLSAAEAPVSSEIESAAVAPTSI